MKNRHNYAENESGCQRDRCQEWYGLTSSQSALPTPPGTRKCWVTPLVYVLGSSDTGACAGGHQLDVIRMLLKRGAKLS